MKIFKGAGILLSIVAVFLILHTALAAVYILDGNRIDADDLIQPITAVSSVKNYPVGTRLQIGDKVYRYAKIGITTAKTHHGYFAATGVSQDLFTSTNIMAEASGATTVRIVRAGTAKNYYQNGYIVHQRGAHLWETVIVSHDSAEATGDTVRLAIADTLFAATLTTDTLGVTRCIYDSVYVPSGDGATATIVGMFVHRNIGSADYKGYYCWLQTWGPAVARIVTSKDWGRQPGQRTLYYVRDGMARAPDSTKAYAVKDSTGTMKTGLFADSLSSGGFQEVAHYLMPTSFGTNYTTPVRVYLTIAP